MRIKPNVYDSEIMLNGMQEMLGFDKKIDI